MAQVTDLVDLQRQAQLETKLGSGQMGLSGEWMIARRQGFPECLVGKLGMVG